MYKVLIIDDDKLARRGIISMLPWDKYGMTVVGEAQNGEQALDFLERMQADIAFVDLDMPVMDGISFMEKCNSLFPELLFVVLTFHEDFLYVQSALRMGAIDYISKMQMETIDCDKLLGRISSKISNIVTRYGKTQKTQDGLSACIMPTDGNKGWNQLIRKWKEMYWIYDDSQFEQLCDHTIGMKVSVRKVEHSLLPLVRHAEECMGIPEKEIVEYHKSEDFFLWLKNFRDELYCKAATELRLENMPVCILRSVIYLKQHLGECLHAEEVAQQVNLSRSYFSVNFKKHTGLSFKEFVRKERIRAAQELLAIGNSLVADISQAVGYEDVNYFIRVFYKLSGMTPGEYRKQIDHDKCYIKIKHHS